MESPQKTTCVCVCERERENHYFQDSLMKKDHLFKIVILKNIAEEKSCLNPKLLNSSVFLIFSVYVNPHGVQSVLFLSTSILHLSWLYFIITVDTFFFTPKEWK